VRDPVCALGALGELICALVVAGDVEWAAGYAEMAADAFLMVGDHRAGFRPGQGAR
jgi:hypothetical protein